MSEERGGASAQHGGAAQLVDSEERNALPSVRVVWQVEYAENRMSYWWDYNESVSEGLEGAREKDNILRFSWAWPDGRLSDYKADPTHGFVTYLHTNHKMRLRRIFVQEPPSNWHCMLGVRWQVAYEHRGVLCW